MQLHLNTASYIETIYNLWISLKLNSKCSFKYSKDEGVLFLHKNIKYCYVRQCWSICTILLGLSRGLASHTLLFIGRTAIHNCLSLGSLVFAHLGSMKGI